MKIEIWNEPEPKEEEKVLRLRLVSEGDRVSIRAVDADGVSVAGGHLAYINENGIYIVGYVSSETGIALDPSGRMKVRTGSGPLN